MQRMMQEIADIDPFWQYYYNVDLKWYVRHAHTGYFIAGKTIFDVVSILFLHYFGGDKYQLIANSSLELIKKG